MSDFHPGDMVEVIERGRTRCFGQIRMRALWAKDMEPYYLVMPDGQKSLSDAIGVFHKQLHPAPRIQIANENFRASESVM